MFEFASVYTRCRILDVRCSSRIEQCRLATSGWYFNEALSNIIRPPTRLDHTCFRNVTSWLVTGCAMGWFNDAIFDRVLDYAKEAAVARDPADTFVALLKKELGYRPISAKNAGTPERK